MSDGGKGSKARPIEVSSQTYSDNWERTFGKHSCKATISGCANDGCTGIANCLFDTKTNNKCRLSKDEETCDNKNCPQDTEYNPKGCILYVGPDL
jgi:hypothetical protein